MGIAVGILLLCGLELEVRLGAKYLLLVGKRRKTKKPSCRWVADRTADLALGAK